MVEDDELIASAVALGHRIARFSEYGVRMTKEVMWANVDAPSVGHAVELEYRTQVLGVVGGDVVEAVRAFREGRSPAWSRF